MINSFENVHSKRDQINTIDSEILDLLNRRAEIALLLGEVKVAGNGSLCDEDRERQVLNRLCSLNIGPLDEQAVRNIFQRVIDESLYLQQKTFQRQAVHSVRIISDVRRTRVAVLGEPGTFSEQAAVALLGEKNEIVWQRNFDELFAAVDRGQADHILAPIENGAVGHIQHSFDLFLSTGLMIIAEVYLPISQSLIACPDTVFDTIKTVESHPAALAQCEIFFSENPHLVRLEAADTASSVRRAIESGDVTRAAIGSARAAELFGGKIIRSNIEDHIDNWTRFVLLSRDGRDEGRKMSLILRLKHKPGSLHSALRPLVRREINLLKIDSRPVKAKPTQYDFFVEIEVPAAESELEAALAEISEHSNEVRLLGRYSTLDLTKGAVS
jgi:chorismate mutase/prephenate dehydratase